MTILAGEGHVLDEWLIHGRKLHTESSCQYFLHREYNAYNQLVFGVFVIKAVTDLA